MTETDPRGSAPKGSSVGILVSSGYNPPPQRTRPAPQPEPEEQAPAEDNRGPGNGRGGGPPGEDDD